MALVPTWYDLSVGPPGIYTNCTQNVHEGPIGIGTRVQYSEVSLSPGNVISDGMSPSPFETIHLI
jgi:hypothetical protein